MSLSTRKCAEILNVTNKTIRNYIKSGKLSASKDENASYIIEESEFYRVFPERKPKEKITPKLEKTAEIEIALLEEKINSLVRENDLLRSQLEDYKSRESKLMEMANSTTKLLTYTAQNKKKKGWFRK